jgi:hypothetical protein
MSYRRLSAVLPRPPAPAVRTLLGSAAELPAAAAAAAAAAALLSCSRRSAMVVSGRALWSTSSCCTNLRGDKAVATHAVLVQAGTTQDMLL